MKRHWRNKMLSLLLQLTLVVVAESVVATVLVAEQVCTVVEEKVADWPDAKTVSEESFSTQWGIPTVVPSPTRHLLKVHRQRGQLQPMRIPITRRVAQETSWHVNQHQSAIKRIAGPN